jgi:hypothetical protein
MSPFNHKALCYTFVHKNTVSTRARLTTPGGLRTGKQCPQISEFSDVNGTLENKSSKTKSQTNTHTNLEELPIEDGVPGGGLVAVYTFNQPTKEVQDVDLERVVLIVEMPDAFKID